MKLHRNTVWFIPLLFIVTFPLWSVPVGDFLTPRGGISPNLNQEPADHHNFNMQTIRILQNQKGKDTAIIRAEKARTNPSNLDLVILDKVDAEIFDDDGNVTHITSDSGEYNLAANALSLIKDVVVNKTRDKQFMYTDLLLYNSEKRTVICPGKTRLKSEDAEIDGGSLEYDINSQTYVIGKRVKCLIKGFIKP
jgi:LPS export ABC transporter protein LptC